MKLQIARGTMSLGGVHMLNPHPSKKELREGVVGGVSALWIKHQAGSRKH